MPVLDHATHESTVASAQGYGCKNKERAIVYFAPGGLVPAYAGSMQMHVQTVPVANRMSKECRYDMSLMDGRCEGCTKRGQGEEYDQRIRSDGK
jgi:hypothetical protein